MLPLDCAHVLPRAVLRQAVEHRRARACPVVIRSGRAVVGCPRIAGRSPMCGASVAATCAAVCDAPPVPVGLGIDPRARP
jgi:hypothetical protein